MLEFDTTFISTIYFHCQTHETLCDLSKNESNNNQQKLKIKPIQVKAKNAISCHVCDTHNVCDSIKMFDTSLAYSVILYAQTQTKASTQLPLMTTMYVSPSK